MMAVAIIAFCLGVYGILTRRDVIRLLFSASLMVSGVTLLAVMRGNPTIVLFAWIVEVVEVILAIALTIYLSRKGISDVTGLRGFRW